MRSIIKSLQRNPQNRLLSMLSPAEAVTIPFKVESKLPIAAKPAVSVLSNGVRVTTKGQVAPIVSFKVSIAAGSSYEGSDAKGAAHYLSSTSFIGTATKSGIRLIRDLENIGASFRSTADRENITISVDVMSDKVEQAFSLIAESIIYPPKALYVFSEAKDFAKLAYDDFKSSPLKHLDELVHETAYGDSSSFGASFYAEDVESVSIESVLAYRSQQYKAGNISIFGNGLSHESLCALAECYLQKAPEGSTSKVSAEYVGGELKVRSDLKGATYGAIAFSVATQKDEASVVFDALSKAVKLSGAPKGSVVPFFAPSSFGGLLGIFSSGDPLSDSLQVGINGLKQIAAGQVDVESSIKKISLENAVSNDSTGVVDSSSPSAVSKDGVLKFVSSLLQSKPTYVVYGKTTGSPSYATVQSWLK